MGQRQGPLQLALALALTVALPGQARAGASFLGEIEVVGQGMAGATVASPDGLGAVWYNPAALAGQKGLRVQVEGGLQYSPLTYQRAPDAQSDSYPAVSNLEPWGPSFFAAMSYDFGVPNLAVAIAAYSPVSGHYGYADTGPHQFMLVRQSPFLATLHAGVAYRLGIVSFGLMAGTSMVGAKLTTHVSGALSGSAEDPAFAIPVTVDVFDPFALSFNLGVRVQASEALSFGLSFQPPYDANMTGTVDIRMPETLSFVEVRGRRVAIDAFLPWTFRAGVKWRPLALLSLDAAFVAQGFSRYRELAVKADVFILGEPLPPIVIEKRFQDTYAARIGAELRPLPWLRARVGVAYETSGVLPEVFDLGTPDANKLWLGMGVGLAFGRFRIDASYMHMFVPTVTTARSVTTVGPLVELSTATPVRLGNGSYSFSMDVFHVGLGLVLFDDTAAP